MDSPAPVQQAPEAEAQPDWQLKLTDLPEEAQAMILGCLEFTERHKNAMLVCKRWSELVATPTSLRVVTAVLQGDRARRGLKGLGLVLKKHGAGQTQSLQLKYSIPGRFKWPAANAEGREPTEEELQQARDKCAKVGVRVYNSFSLLMQPEQQLALENDPFAVDVGLLDPDQVLDELRAAYASARTAADLIKLVAALPGDGGSSALEELLLDIALPFDTGATPPCVVLGRQMAHGLRSLRHLSVNANGIGLGPPQFVLGDISVMSRLSSLQLEPEPTFSADMCLPASLATLKLDEFYMVNSAALTRQASRLVNLSRLHVPSNVDPGLLAGLPALRTLCTRGRGCPGGIGQLTALQSLKIRASTLSDGEFPAALAGLSCLTFLELSDVAVDDDNHGAACQTHLLCALAGLPRLQQLVWEVNGAGNVHVPLQPGPWLGSLRSLQLPSVAMAADSLGVLSAATQLAELAVFDNNCHHNESSRASLAPLLVEVVAWAAQQPSLTSIYLNSIYGSLASCPDVVHDAIESACQRHTRLDVYL